MYTCIYVYMYTYIYIHMHNPLLPQCRYRSARTAHSRTASWMKGRTTGAKSSTRHPPSNRISGQG